MLSLHEEEEEELMEDKRNNKAQMPHTPWNPKRHISLVNLLLCHKIVAVQWFIWCLGLRMWAGSETKFRVFTNLLYSHLKMFSYFKCNI